MEIRTVGVVGLGTMGAGIAEVFARGGLEVTAVEVDAGALARGLKTLDGSLGRAVAKGRLTEYEREEIMGRVTPAQKYADLATADLVVEVVPERLEIKRQVFAELDQACRADAIIATNTSSLSVTTIAAGSAHPGRVIGMHFFNPAPVMRLVEVVTTVLAEPSAASAVAELARRLGKTPVQVTDRAGFIANALLLPYLNHAVRLLETGYASREDIDTAVTAGIGLPMGPLTLLDLIGLDTSLSVLEVLDREFGGTRYRPAPLLRRLTDAGHVGRKSGRGFYDYSGQNADPAADQAPEREAPGTVTLIDAGDQPATAELASLIAAAGLNVTRNPAHPTDLAIVATGMTGRVLEPALAAGRAADAVGIALIYRGTPELAQLATSPLTTEAALAAARALAAKLGVRAVHSADRPGLLVHTLLYPHLNDAVAMVADGYATPEDIDSAMTLGCGYRHGPMRMLDGNDLTRVTGVLAEMHATYGDPAFVPSPLLVDYARARVRFLPQQYSPPPGQ
ncbi:MAG TPA: 3-hydroxybutyryl-CoA dehydrogenase [Streptosporangiaceae bacterium]|nr:3-hydroxybutyryl-CoA dehydrogenase [Streptosporangiaceae bacterium]